MALTKITRGVIKANENYDTHNINSTGIVTAVSANFTGNVSIGGTLTYQDVTNIDSVGVVTARAGVHVTGGNLAVGHNNPSVNLHVRGSASNGQIYLGGTGAHSQIYADNDGVLILNADQGNSAANSYLGFNVDNSEKVRIDSAGSVIIGDSDTDNANAIANDLVIGNTSQRSGITIVSGSGDDGNIFFSDGTGTAALKGQIVYNHTGDRFSFYTAAAERLRIDSSGRLLLGTTTEGYTSADDLTVANTGNTGITIRSGTGNLGTIAYSDGTSGDAEYRGYFQYDHNGDFLKIGTAGAERLRIKNNGTVHIGDAFEGGGYLNVYANNVENGIDLIGQISNSNQNSNSPKIRFQGHAQSNGPWIQGINVDGYGYKDLVFGVNRTATNYTTLPTETARFTQDGRFMVNTTSSRIVEDWSGNGPQGRIQIEQTNSNALMSIISAGTADANRAGTLVLGRHRNSTIGGTPTIVQSGDHTGAIVFAGGDGSDMRSKSAVITSRVGATPGSSKIPGDLLFLTTNTDDGDQPEERLIIDHRASFIRRYPRLTTSGVYNPGGTRGYNSSATGTVRLPGAEGDTFYFSVTMPSYYSSGSVPGTVKASIQYATYHASGFGAGEYLIHQRHGANGGRRLDVTHYRKLSEVYSGGWYYGMNTNFTTRLYETTNDEANASIVFRVQVRTGNGSTYDGSAKLHIKIETLGGHANHPEPRITWHGTSSPSGLGSEVTSVTNSWP